MKETINNIKLGIRQRESELKKIVAKRYRREVNFRILKKSLDARNKSDIKWIYSLEVSDEETPVREYPQAKKQPKQVLIVGSGPAGLFCAVQLVRHGILPVVIERGGDVDERKKDNERFFTTHLLDTESNVQFGEGGAGTFSDGKLNTQTNNEQNKLVLETFVQFGAPQDICYLSKPHIGSDKLPSVVKNMRRYIEANGGKVLFRTKLTDIVVKDGTIAQAILSDGKKIEVSHLVLALGHSARDTFEMLYSKGIAFEQKEFAVGMRIEHLQRNVGLAQYGENYKYLPAADYKLVSHAGERAVFSFCMCPGGYVMPSASERGGVVVNGMSCYARDGVNANSALVAQVKKQDYASEHPLAGIEYQRKIERSAYLLGGGDYRAPVQLLGDFLKGRVREGFGEVLPTYAAGTRFADLNEVLPSVITSSIKEAFPDMERRLKGFSAPDALLSGVESRTSSPVRMTRGEDYQSVSVKGIYPVGEGAGYAGGITSAAADGIRAAEIIFNECR